MKRIVFLSVLAIAIFTLTAKAQTIIPDGYTATHSDSSWNIMLNYYIDDIPGDKQLEM